MRNTGLIAILFVLGTINLNAMSGEGRSIVLNRLENKSGGDITIQMPGQIRIIMKGDEGKSREVGLHITVTAGTPTTFRTKLGEVTLKLEGGKFIMQSAQGKAPLAYERYQQSNVIIEPNGFVNLVPFGAGAR